MRKERQEDSKPTPLAITNRAIRSAFWLNVIENPTLHGLHKKYECR